ncbi:hypothetical protein NECAME_14899 [Necator americanus]|uniref:Secreted protein n=1 Tax=Necator americanus TaxID=51031 RepID=W2SN28_NECAM|nr:hypothetical protein NECAME_14899 [Necator americanus]ETN70246.1 hypothetical protein NECAME_14899 [Necator americanus]
MKARLIVSVIYVLLLTADRNSANQQACEISNPEENLHRLVIFWKELRFNAALGQKYQRRVNLGPGGECMLL